MGGFFTTLSLAEQALSAWTGSTGAGFTAWFLAMIFGISGIAKLRRPVLAAMAAVDFGVVRRVRPGLGRLLGACEVSLAIALPTLPYPAGIVAAVVLWGFAALIARSLRAGETFSCFCFCFGESESLVSRWTLARTTALALAATVLVLSAPPAIRRFSFDTLLEVVVAASLLGSFVLGDRVRSLLPANSTSFAERAEVVA